MTDRGAPQGTSREDIALRVAVPVLAWCMERERARKELLDGIGGNIGETLKWLKAFPMGIDQG
jgi:hypothetical protein